MARPARCAPTGRTLLDVGGGPGYFAAAFDDAGCTYIGVEPDPAEMHAGPAAERPARRTFVRASGLALPFADDSVDICLSSNVAEHVTDRGGWAARCCGSPGPAGWWCCRTRCGWGRSAGTRRGCGTTSAGARAAKRYTRKHGHPPKNDYGSSLFAVSAADGLRWADSTGALLTAFPRYHPRWAWWMVRVPVLREFLVSNLVLVLRPPTTATGSRFPIRG